MVNLFDIMRQAQSGAGLHNLSRQFGLTSAQTQNAIEALLPAFSLGFMRNAQHPSAFANLLGMMGSGQYAPYFDMLPRPPQALPAGETALAQLFGSPEIARQVAAQASAASGVGAQVIQQMLPIVAGMLMGGIFRFASVEGFATFLRQWSDALRAADRPPAPKHAAPMAAFDPFAAWQAALGPATRPEAPPRAEPTSDKLIAAWSNLMTAMMGGPAPAPAAPKPPPAPTVVETMFRMFETGRDVQAKYLEELRLVFDRGWSTHPGG